MLKAHALAFGWHVAALALNAAAMSYFNDPFFAALALVNAACLGHESSMLLHWLGVWRIA